MGKHLALLEIICTDSSILWFSHLPTLTISFSKKTNKKKTFSAFTLTKMHMLSILKNLAAKEKHSLSPFRHNCYFCSDSCVHGFFPSFFHFLLMIVICINSCVAEMLSLLREPSFKSPSISTVSFHLEVHLSLKS